MSWADPYEAVTTSSAELAQEVRKEADGPESERRPSPLAILHYRGGEEEFSLGARYCESADPLDRITGARILGELGMAYSGTYVAESVDIMIRLLADESPEVIARTAACLNYRADPRVSSHLARLADHPDEEVRYGVVGGLLERTDALSITTLIRLSRDTCTRVRDWAIFGLGSQIEVDTPEIREALVHALNDEDDIVMGEAMVGLANRGDRRVIPALLTWLENEQAFGLPLEAASLIADPVLISPLEKLLAEMDGDGSAEWIQEAPDWSTEHPGWRGEVLDALSRCRGEIGSEGNPRD